MRRTLPVITKSQGDRNRSLLPIIKWQLPTDILIEILSFIDLKELKYLCTFDPKCNLIKNNPKYYSRIFIRKIQRSIPVNPPSFENIRKAYRLFGNLEEESRFNYTALYFNSPSGLAANTVLSELLVIDIGKGNFPISVGTCLKAISLGKKDFVTNFLKQNTYLSCLYFYLIKYGKEETNKLLDQMSPILNLPSIYHCDEILIPMKRKWKSVVLQILETGNYGLTVSLNIQDPIDQIYFGLFQDPDSMLSKCYLSNVKELSPDIVDKLIHDNRGIGYPHFPDLLFAACRDNAIEIVNKIGYPTYDKFRLILTNSLPEWPIVDDLLNEICTCSEYYNIIIQIPLHPRIIEKIARSAYKKLELDMYLQLIKMFVPRKKNLQNFSYSPVIVSIFENIITAEEDNDEDNEEEKVKKDKERKYSSRKQKIGLVTEKYGPRCLWKFTKSGANRVCERRRADGSTYFCKSHSKYKGAIEQESCIDSILEDKQKETKLFKEVATHLELISSLKDN